MKLKKLFIFSLLSSFALSSIGLGCGGEEAKQEQVAATQPEQVATTSQTKSNEEAKKAAEAQLKELENALKEAEKAFNDNAATLKKEIEKRAQLEDKDAELKDIERADLENLREEKAQTLQKLSDYRDKLSQEVVQVEDAVRMAVERITNVEEEFRNLPVFGRVNLTKEILTYTLGFKWLWGLFTGYRATFFTYEPEYSAAIRNQLAQIQEKMVAAQQEIKSAITPKNSESIFADLANAKIKVEESLNFLKTNQVAKETYALRYSDAAANAQSSILTIIGNLLPANQKILEDVEEEINQKILAAKKREAELQKLNDSIQKLQAISQTLSAEVRLRSAKVEQAKAELKKL